MATSKPNSRRVSRCQPDFAEFRQRADQAFDARRELAPTVTARQSQRRYRFGFRTRVASQYRTPAGRSRERRRRAIRLHNVNGGISIHSTWNAVVATGSHGRGLPSR